MRIFLIWIIISLSLFLNAQDSDIWFHPNRGQWEEEIKYKVELSQGAFYVEKDKFTFFFHDLHKVYGHSHGETCEHGHHHFEDDKISCHAVKMHFLNSDWSGKATETDTSNFYRNYFIGEDSSKWASEVASYQSITLHDYYEGIDLVLNVGVDYIKYHFVVHPDGDFNKIAILYEGADSLSVENQDILVHTTFGPIEDKGLKVWNEREGRTTELTANYLRSSDTLSYQIENPKAGETLVIDPQLTFSTFTGSTSDNWGFTAAPDPAGNTFGGGIVFGAGYPTTTGAYDVSFNGGEGNFNLDIGISKFNTTGSSLVYSTYIGGARNEAPKSIVSNENGEIYVLGVTSSVNFPMAGNPVQPAFAGGTLTTQNALQFSGTDLVLFKFNAAGTNLMASTYYGGSANDGLNLGTLHYNYGDQFRGEIIVDEQSNVYIASSTQSADFPTPNGSKTFLSGNQDAVIAKFNPQLSNVFWSTYFGGNGLETGNALQINSSGDVFVTGGTTSNGLPFSGGHAPSFLGGISDGYIAQLNANNSSLINGTYVGTNNYDQCYFVQLDLDDNVYVFGQTAGAMPITQGLYANPNSGQFIRKYNDNLSGVEWTTRVGGGNNTIEISPTAFLVSDCYEIYYAGWGGQTNHTSQATGSTTSGFPTTPNAFQSNTNGNNFYVAVLGENATSLNYASFIGGISSSANHVDGGTSRFDKKGRIYHAVCASCGNTNNGFTSTPGSYATSAAGPNCNMAVFKFDLGIIESIVSVAESFICIPDAVNFQNNSQNANEFFWDFGDGNTSTDFEPSHAYANPGQYEVLLVASDTNGCYEADSSFVTIEVGLFQGAVTQPPGPICPGEPFELEASGGIIYEWSPAAFLDDSTIANPTAIVFETTTFTVIVSDSCGSDTLEIILEVYGGDASVSDDLSICLGDTVTLSASGGSSYTWSPESAVLFQNDTPNIQISPLETTLYFVDIITPEGCDILDSVLVTVFEDMPMPELDDSIRLCLGNSITVIADGGDTYLWSPNIEINTVVGPTVEISATQDRYYFVDFTNACGTVIDSVFVQVIEVMPLAGNDTIVCKGDTVNLWASGGVSYDWSPSEFVSNPNAANTIAFPSSPTTYTVTVTDENGCFATENVDISHFPTPYVQTTPDQYPFIGDEVLIGANASSNGSFEWSPPDLVDCSGCSFTTTDVEETTTFIVDFTDENGCKASDDITVFFEGIIYVPNTFTPDGDQFNNTFFPKGGNIIDFHMIILNRWGEVVFESFDFKGSWDGTYGGIICPDGVYVWKIKYTDVSNNEGELTGHVTLLR